MNSSKLVAVGADGKEIASIDFGGKGVDLPKLQTFMDKCSAVNKKEAEADKKPSAFVTKTLQMIKEQYGHYQSWSDKKIQDALIEHEEVAKKIMSTTFPAADWSSHGGGKSIKVTDTDEFVFKTHKSIDTTSRNPAFRGSTDYHYTISCKIGNSETVIASGQYSSRSKWETSTEVKNGCKVDALVRYLKIFR